MLTFHQTPFSYSCHTMKRFFDLVIAILALIVLMPLLLIVALLILVTDGSPVLFRQKRVGLNGRYFHLHKFRTMSRSKEAEKGSFDAGDVSRVTPLGRLLRRSKIDELPQLINVIIGHMSIVGPRPEIGKWVDMYPVRWSYVHTVRPGITDPASIIYRNEERILAEAEDPEAVYRDEVLPHKLSLYEAYVENQSLLQDLKILYRTLIVVLFK